MAVAVPSRRGAPAPKPVRTTRPAPVRKPPSRKSPARKPAGRAAAPARRPRARTGRVAAGGQLIPLAAARTAGAVRQIPDSGLMVRLSRGRAWIGLLGVLLAGIVALNVATLSFASSSGQVDRNIQALERENGLLRTRAAHRLGTARVRQEAAGLGLTSAIVDSVQRIEARPSDVRVAAERLAASG
jgi:hypothetical protein